MDLLEKSVLSDTTLAKAAQNKPVILPYTNTSRVAVSARIDISSEDIPATSGTKSAKE